MTSLALLGSGLLACFVLAGVLGHYNDRIRKHGPHALAWRWFTASAGWHGKAVTDRGWTRPGTKALTPTGHAHRRWYWPAWQHSLWRIRNTLIALLLAAGLLFQFRRTLEYLAATAAAGAGYAAWRGQQWAQEYQHRKNYVKPLHARLARLADIPVANRPESWLEVPADRSRAVLTWPKGVPLPKPQEQRAIENAAIATLGMTGAKPKWQYTGPHLKMHLTPPVPCPEDVTLEDIRQAILEAGVDDLVLGVGQDGKVIKVSLQHDSPHMALSVGSGKGKSVLVRCIVPQVLFRGGIAAILDNKLVSHPSLRGLKNVAYADDIDKIHFFLEWLDGELGRRARFIRAHTDVYGRLTGSPGPHLLVILEEQNLLMNRLRSYWSDRLAEDKALPRDMRENLPPVSPAIKGFENASYVGRELKVHLVFIAQRFTAEAAGGGSKGAAVRMNAGIRILAGYDDDTWKMLVGKQTAMPSSSKRRGRMQLYVMGGDLTEVQIAQFTHEESRKFAESGTATVPSKLLHLTEFRWGGVTDPVPPGTVEHGSGGDGSAVIVAPVPELPPPVQNWITIKQAHEAGWLPRNWGKPGIAFRTAKSRAKKEGRRVPEVKAWRGREAYYDAIELADFLEPLKAAG